VAVIPRAGPQHITPGAPARNWSHRRCLENPPGRANVPGRENIQRRRIHSSGGRRRGSLALTETLTRIRSPVTRFGHPGRTISLTRPGQLAGMGSSRNRVAPTRNRTCRAAATTATVTRGGRTVVVEVLAWPQCGNRRPQIEFSEIGLVGIVRATQ